MNEYIIHWNLFTGLSFSDKIFAVFLFVFGGFLIISAMRIGFYLLFIVFDFFVWFDLILALILYFAVGYVLILFFLNLLNEGVCLDFQ